MEFRQLKQCNKIFFFKNHAENETGKLDSNFFFLKKKKKRKKALYEVKASGLQLSCSMFRESST